MSQKPSEECVSMPEWSTVFNISESSGQKNVSLRFIEKEIILTLTRAIFKELFEADTFKMTAFGELNGKGKKAEIITGCT